MVSNFEFLNKEFPVLANFGSLAEKYCFSDSNSCLMKLGMIGETIVNLMFTYDRIRYPEDNTAVNRINKLQKEGLLTSDLASILHELRKKRIRRYRTARLFFRWRTACVNGLCRLMVITDMCTMSL